MWHVKELKNEGHGKKNKVGKKGGECMRRDREHTNKRQQEKNKEGVNGGGGDGACKETKK